MAAEWLVGAVPDGWEYTTLGEACSRGGGDVQTGPFGSQLHASDYVPAGIPSIMPQNIGDNRVVAAKIARIKPEDAERLGRYRVQFGDIVYSRRGDVEKRALIRHEENGWLCGTGCLRVRFGNTKIDPAFAFYYLGDSRVREWIVRHAHGATMPNLNTSILSALPFVVPPRSDQDFITRILGTLDDKIELNRRMNNTLERIAQALFRSWFVAFEPVRAKADGRDPGLPKHLATLFPESFEKSEFGEIPKGWSVVNVGDLAKLSRETLNPREFPDEYFEHYSIPAFDKGQRPKVERGKEIKSNKFVIPGNAILVSKLNPRIPRIWLPTLRAAYRAVCSTEFLVAIPKSYVSREYLFCLLGNEVFGGVFTTLVTGTSGSHQRVKPEGLLRMKVAVPGEALISSFSNTIKPLLARVSLALDETDSLASTRDALLPKLISGQLRVKDAERVVGSRV